MNYNVQTVDTITALKWKEFFNGLQIFEVFFDNYIEYTGLVTKNDTWDENRL